VYAANRAFGFHGLAADFSGAGYDDLLTVDSKSNWHFIVNHAGKFEAAPFALSQENFCSIENRSGAVAVLRFCDDRSASEFRQA